MIDNNPMEIEAMDLFKKGETKKARELQTKFLDEVKASVKNHCSCPAECKYHGKCVECVIIHRGHSDHLPYCFRTMVNDRLNSLSELTEHSIKEAFAVK